MNIITQNSQTYNQTLNLTSTNLAKKKIEPKLKFDSELSRHLRPWRHGCLCLHQPRPVGPASCKARPR